MSQIRKADVSSRRSSTDAVDTDDGDTIEVDSSEVRGRSKSDGDKVDEAYVRTWLQQNQLAGQVRSYASESRGSRLVQVALQIFAFEDDTKVKELVVELRGWVQEAVNSPHANHVLQKAIEFARPQFLPFLVPELLASFSSPADIAKHQFGCRVLERLFEHFPPTSLDHILCFYKVEGCSKKARCTCKAGRCAEGILKDANTVQQLSEHIYASFVLQHIMEHGEQGVQRKILNALIGHPDDKDPCWLNHPGSTSKFLTRAAGNQNARGLLDKALTYGTPEGRRKLAELLVDAEGELVKELALARAPGCDAAIRLFHVLPKGSHHWKKARQQISQHYDQVKKQKHSKELLEASLLDRPADADEIAAHSAVHHSGGSSSGASSSTTSPMLGTSPPGTILQTTPTAGPAIIPPLRLSPNALTMPKANSYSSQQQQQPCHHGLTETAGLPPGVFVQPKAQAVAGLSLQQLLPNTSHQQNARREQFQ
jgi:hypothetical protein